MIFTQDHFTQNVLGVLGLGNLCNKNNGLVCLPKIPKICLFWVKNVTKSMVYLPKILYPLYRGGYISSPPLGKCSAALGLGYGKMCHP
jgi:hypothetical protein